MSDAIESQRSRRARARLALATTAAIVAGVLAGGWWLGERAAARAYVQVVEVVDGDTVVVARPGGARERVRLLGVDTPETVHPDRPVECFGPEAKSFTRRRLAGRWIWLELDSQTRDRYGRLLAYVELDGQRFNDELLRRGYARLLVIPPNLRHGRALLAAETEARRARRGLWQACE